MINPAECPASRDSERVRREGVLDEPTTIISIGPIDVSDALSIDDKVEIDEIILEIEGEIEEQDGRIKIHRKNFIRFHRVTTIHFWGENKFVTRISLKITEHGEA